MNENREDEEDLIGHNNGYENVDESFDIDETVQLNEDGIYDERILDNIDPNYQNTRVLNTNRVEILRQRLRLIGARRREFLVRTRNIEVTVSKFYLNHVFYRYVFAMNLELEIMTREDWTILVQIIRILVY